MKLFENLEKVIFRVDSDSISLKDNDGAKKNETSTRGEMKSILKTLSDTLNLDYEEIFMSSSNVNTRKKLIPELIKVLKLNFQPTYDQITKWLKFIHKSRRSRNSYKNKGRLDADNRCLHANGKIKDV
ncbi:hypothetical protein RhiirA4_471087 [Rhizophagus irregularis]|uniref:Uncharacterized protein n=1 Tax=Rhizophagus irregularis TaxID=588596 RepID=A0A2I1H2G5_9GLOM|nr:hypothetical protein RhiirA4_471087 [Rhizophagus irregularis]